MLRLHLILGVCGVDTVEVSPNTISESLLVFCRLGFIIDFLSKPTLTGFMGGAAVLVSLQQLKGLLGIVHFTTKMAIIPVLKSVFDNRKEVTKGFLEDLDDRLLRFCCLINLYFSVRAVVMGSSSYGSLIPGSPTDGKTHSKLSIHPSNRYTSFIKMNS